jgi:hypothetical protein
VSAPLRRKTPVTRTASVKDRTDSLERRYSRQGQYEIKLAPDNDTVDTGDGNFIFSIPDDLNELHLRAAEAFVSTAGSTATQIMVRNITQATDMLTTIIEIDAGQLDSRDSTPRSVIDTTNNEVFAKDQIALDVDANGTDALGHGVMLLFT